MRTPKKLIWSDRLRLTKVNRIFHEGPLYQILGPIDDLIRLGFVAWDSHNKLIGGPGIRNIVVNENMEMRIEILADFLLRHDPDFVRFLAKCQGEK